MIKVTAKNESGKTCSFSSKANRRISRQDLVRIEEFTRLSIRNSQRVTINYKITYDNPIERPIYVSSMSSRVFVLYEDRLGRALNDIIHSVNINMKTR